MKTAVDFLIERIKESLNNGDIDFTLYEFEKYVLSQFNKDEYRLHEWRGDKYLRGWGGPPTNSSPDLELEHTKSGERFAVECKNRTHLSDKKFMWATPIKHRKYIAYQQKTHIPVYVAFGLGGEPMAPAFFAVMPLVAIQYPDLYIGRIAPYRRNGEGLRLDEIKHPTMRHWKRATGGASPER